MLDIQAIESLFSVDVIDNNDNKAEFVQVKSRKASFLEACNDASKQASVKDKTFDDLLSVAAKDRKSSFIKNGSSRNTVHDDLLPQWRYRSIGLVQVAIFATTVDGSKTFKHDSIIGCLKWKLKQSSNWKPIGILKLVSKNSVQSIQFASKEFHTLDQTYLPLILDCCKSFGLLPNNPVRDRNLSAGLQTVLSCKELQEYLGIKLTIPDNRDLPYTVISDDRDKNYNPVARSNLQNKKFGAMTTKLQAENRALKRKVEKLEKKSEYLGTKYDRLKQDKIIKLLTPKSQQRPN